jgi:hypothetical protein
MMRSLPFSMTTILTVASCFSCAKVAVDIQMAKAVVNRYFMIFGF